MKTKSPVGFTENNSKECANNNNNIIIIIFIGEACAKLARFWRENYFFLAKENERRRCLGFKNSLPWDVVHYKQRGESRVQGRNTSASATTACFFVSDQRRMLYCVARVYRALLETWLTRSSMGIIPNISIMHMHTTSRKAQN